MKNRSSDLHKAKQNKKDDFYTQLTDIEKELKYYKNELAGSTIYCNCDDPKISNFFHYFSYNFESLKLKKLITTCYKNKQVDLFSTEKSNSAVFLEYNGDKNKNKIPDPEEIDVQELEGDGDFRSQESISFLKESDIVVTNPPFSLFREFIQQLIDYEKKFIVIGSINAITYKETFRLIKAKKMWLGASIHSGDREFGVPNDYPLNASGSRVDEHGNKFISVKGVRWWTNIDYRERHEDLVLFKKFNTNEYPKYDNYDAIEVKKTKEIPYDYDGVMGVPITFLDYYNPDQFEVLGMSASAGYDESIVGIPFLGEKDARPLIDGKNTYARIFIRNKTI